MMGQGETAAGSGALQTELTLTIGPVAHGGHCVARHQGRVVFVRHAIPGEVVRVRLTGHDDDAAHFWRADVTEVLESAPERVPHFWPEADALAAAARGTLPVGGAEFGHISRAGQRRLKAAVLAEQLQRLAKLDLAELDPAVLAAGPGDPPEAGPGVAAGAGIMVEDVDASGSPEQAAGMGWRTRAGFAVTGGGIAPDGGHRLGMHAHRSTTVIPIREMPLADEGINALRLWEMDLEGIMRVEVAAPANGSEPLVLLAPDPALSPKAAGHVLKRVAAQLAAVAGDQGVSLAGWDPESGQLTQLRGRGWVRESGAGHEFRVSGDGFWQIHRRAPEVLTTAALGFLTAGGYLDQGSAVADLYAGAGLFTAPLADAVGPTGTVLSVEGSPGTSRDARKNLHASAQVEIQRGRVERVLGAQRRSFDAVVLDPPRAGAGKTVVRQLIDSRPRAIAYVSCDPASFARDLGYFRRAGWDLARLRAFDLYPHTHHLETVALLTPGSRY
ncbi:MAG TPA: TRAM domain-containing protein [Micrococcaceae bacterium]|nr:TRAM domain-containing protein [Micrococcaceae bacterium]